MDIHLEILVSVLVSVLEMLLRPSIPHFTAIDSERLRLGTWRALQWGECYR
jgi:hypothetical protein